MPIDSGAAQLPRKKRRIADQSVEGDISPGLRKHITQAAEKIRAAHKDELADGLKANRAGRLFSNIIGANEASPVGSPEESPGGSGQSVESLAGEFGGLLSNAIREQAGLLEGSLTVLTRAWMTTMLGPLAKTNLGMAESTVDTAVPGGQAPDMPASSPEELMLRGVLRKFMPMLLASVNQGGDGCGLAKTVIALFGRPTYDQVSGLGSDKIMRLIKSEPDLSDPGGAD